MLTVAVAWLPSGGTRRVAQRYGEAFVVLGYRVVEQRNGNGLDRLPCGKCQQARCCRIVGARERAAVARCKRNGRRRIHVSAALNRDVRGGRRLRQGDDRIAHGNGWCGIVVDDRDQNSPRRYQRAARAGILDADRKRLVPFGVGVIDDRDGKRLAALAVPENNLPGIRSAIEGRRRDSPLRPALLRRRRPRWSCTPMSSGRSCRLCERR